VFTNKKREGIDTFVCAVSVYVAKTSKALIKDQELQLPIIPFGIVVYGFVGQPFSKQLYKPHKNHNSSIRPDEELTLGTVTSLSCYTSHLSSITVSVETYPSISNAGMPNFKIKESDANS